MSLTQIDRDSQIKPGTDNGLVFNDGSGKMTDGSTLTWDGTTLDVGSDITADSGTGAVSATSLTLTDALDIASGGTNSTTVLTGDFLMVSNGTSIIQISSAGTFSANGSLLTNLANPVSAQDAVTKAYVDNYNQGISWKQVVAAATAAVLPAYAYSNGASGVGATLTGTTNGALSVDSYVVSVNDRILVKNETTGTTTVSSIPVVNTFSVLSATGIYVGTILTDTTYSYTTTVTAVTGTSITVTAIGPIVNGDSLTWDDKPFNGIYTVTATGSVSTVYVLTRALDQDTSNQFPASATIAEQGTANADIGFVCTSQPPVTVGTTDITWVQFTSVGTYTAGNGLDLTGYQFSISTDSTLTAYAGGSTPSLTLNISTSRTSGGILYDTDSSSGFGESVNLTWDSSNSRLGIGTNTPAYTLDITGTGHSSSDFYVDGVFYTDEITTRPGTPYPSSLTIHPANDVGGPSADLILSGSNNTGNPNSNGASLVLTGFPNGPSHATLTTGVNGAFIILTQSGFSSPVEVARFLPGGNVGIGTATPAFTLDVNGQGNFNGNQIHTVADPTVAQDAATKNYVDTSIAAITVIFVTRETPSGAVDGVNTVFTLANTPTTGSEEVFTNGLLQTVGGGFDYTISGATITFNVAPLVSSIIRVNYRH